jgi:peptide/nickel transport system substrate-binding protein
MRAGTGLAAGILALAASVGGCRRAATVDPPTVDAVDIAVPWEIATLDPHAEDKVSNHALWTNVYESLVTLGNGLEVRPALAESWESPHPLRWVFKLRRNVHFHGGQPFGARDVVASVQRILGGRDLQIRNYLSEVTEVQALDEHTVEIRTSQPSRGLLNKLSFVAVISAAADPATLTSTANGTGPYRLARWEPGRLVSVARHDGWWGPRPAVRAATFHLAQSTDAVIAGLQAGRFPLAQADSRRLSAALQGSTSHEVLRRDNLFVKYLAFDVAHETTPYVPGRPNPFRDARVRRAIHAAIDRHRMVKEMWGYAVPATQPVPRLVFGFNPRIPEPAADRELAARLLAEAGVTGGFEVVLHARRILADAAALVREELAGVGIRVTLKELPDEEFFDLVGRGAASLWINRFGCTTGDATEILNDVLHTRDEARHLGMLNYGGHGDARLDVEIEAVGRIEDSGIRRDAIQRILERVMDEVIVVPLYNDQDVYALSRAYVWEPRSDSHIRVAEITLRR